MAESGSTLLKPGQVFAGRYRIERLLAQGGHGAVFVAEQLATEATVAVKVLWPHVLASADTANRFELEAKVAGRVKSEYIVRVLDAGIDEETGMPFLVMELLEGESLTEHINQHGPLSPLDTATYFLQMAHALDKAHGYTDKRGHVQPIVHRDLKPDNVFLAVRHDGQRTVKILDFGIAKVLSETADMSQGIKGTPLYMAYEQASGGAITPSTDIWAFGLIAFFLLTGKCYWRSAARGVAHLSAIFGEVLQQPIIPPSERARELDVEVTWPGDFDNWFLRCLDRNPDARFSSAGAAASNLVEALLGAEFAQTLPTSALSTAPPVASTHPLALTAPPRSRARWVALTLGVLLLGTLGYVAIQLRSQRAARDLARVPSASHQTMNGSAPVPVSAALVSPPLPSASAAATSEPAAGAAASKPASAPSAEPESAKLRARKGSPPGVRHRSSPAESKAAVPAPPRSVTSSRIYSER